MSRPRFTSPIKELRKPFDDLFDSLEDLYSGFDDLISVPSGSDGTEEITVTEETHPDGRVVITKKVIRKITIAPEKK